MRVSLIVVLILPLVSFAQPASVQTCVACHGARGEGNPTNGYPRIAGQPREYLRRQLEAYVDGRRENPVMAPIAKQLTPEQRSELAAYYSRQSPPPAKDAARPANTQRGQTLATAGDESLRVQACQNCHGPGGTGFGNLVPYLAGLDAKYLAAALQEWRDGKRKTDSSQQMTQIAKALTDADTKAVAAYYASRQPPK